MLADDPTASCRALGHRWCVIGAGPSGLTALKNLLAAGIDAECLEREDDVGGNWYFGSAASRVHDSTRLISSKALTAFTDFPMPRHWPAYPGHRQCLDYLRRYAAAFGLLPHIRTHSAVDRIELTDVGWRVSTQHAAPRTYGGVVIANGHNHTPRFPDIPGTFTGDLLHAGDYKSPTQPVPIAGRRVLVIGGGNSGCDIAVDCAAQAASTTLSWRRGYHIVPRFIAGRPADLRSERLLRLGLPLWLRRFISLRAINREIGLPWRSGLPRPDHRLWETHPIVNTEVLARLTERRIRPAGAVERFCGRRVDFAHGASDEFDVVICATGYHTVLPFIAPQLLNADRDGCPRLFMNLLHPSRDDIAVVGLIQPDSGQWWLTDLQGQLVARMAVAAQRAPQAAAWLYRARQQPTPRPIRYVDSPRHRLEVEHYSYAHRLRRLIAAMDRRLRAQAC